MEEVRIAMMMATVKRKINDLKRFETLLQFDT